MPFFGPSNHQRLMRQPQVSAIEQRLAVAGSTQMPFGQTAGCGSTVREEPSLRIVADDAAVAARLPSASTIQSCIS